MNESTTETADRKRRRPALVFRVPLEGPAVAVLEADSYEDELRLRSWLRRARSSMLTREGLDKFLDELDTRERAA